MATQTMPQPAVAGAKAISSAKPSLWILDRWRDLLLFVGTPVLLIPIFTAAQARWSAQDIFLFVGAFGAMGHHLPGMIRAYGDRALFDRFKIRFVVAPVALLAVCIWSSVYNIQAVQLVALAWGIWHGMMQTYGFCRIYDAKASAKAAARARIDLALCFAWFLGAVLLSPMRFRGSLSLYYESGGPSIPAAFIQGLRVVAWASLGLVTASALLHFYYDGFIWKVRETQMRAMLGISGTGAAATTALRAWPAWTRHTMRWAALIIPFGALCAAQLGGRVVPPLERTEKV